jgi:hypothetical protein
MGQTPACVDHGVLAHAGFLENPDNIGKPVLEIRTVGRGVALDKAIEQPCSGGSRRRVGAVNRVEAVAPAAVVGQVEAHQSAGSKIGCHHRLRHVAPAHTFEQQRMLGTEIGQPPSFGNYSAACRRQLRPPSAGAVEQEQPELRLQIGNAIAHRRFGAPQRPTGGGKAAMLNHGEEVLKLIEAGRADLGNFEIPERFDRLDACFPESQAVQNKQPTWRPKRPKTGDRP